MSHFELIQDPGENPELGRLYEEIVAQGFGQEVPINWFTAQGQRPDLLAATWTLVKGVLTGGVLPASVKQMVALAVSVQNDCRYCSVTHTRALEALGVPQEVIRSCLTDPDLSQLPPPHRAIVRYAVRAADDPNQITAEDYAALREAGLEEAEVLEAAMLVSFMSFVNRWAELSGIEVDGEE